MSKENTSKQINEYHFGDPKKNSNNSKKYKPKKKKVVSISEQADQKDLTSKKSYNKQNKKRSSRHKSHKKKKTQRGRVKTAEDVRRDNEHLEKEIILDIQSIRQIEIE
ncbi:MAG: hypothetical protein GX326_01115 [Clostridiaceae bacterium]|nr:hypothetical protein [Clostridiaceae bacterium]